MDHAAVFLLGVYLLPLAVVSAISAWSDNRRPLLGGLLLICASGLLGWVWFTREEGLFTFRDVPDLTVMMAARVLALF